MIYRVLQQRFISAAAAAAVATPINFHVTKTLQIVVRITGAGECAKVAADRACKRTEAIDGRLFLSNGLRSVNDARRDAGTIVSTKRKPSKHIYF